MGDDDFSNRMPFHRFQKCIELFPFEVQPAADIRQPFIHAQPLRDYKRFQGCFLAGQVVLLIAAGDARIAHGLPLFLLGDRGSAQTGICLTFRIKSPPSLCTVGDQNPFSIPTL